VRRLFLAVTALLALAVVGIAAPKAEATTCPLYRACMETPEGQCFCTGFFCNGKFICGIPVT
jgi:hypothetical protein